MITLVIKYVGPRGNMVAEIKADLIALSRRVRMSSLESHRIFDGIDTIICTFESSVNKLTLKKAMITKMKAV